MTKKNYAYFDLSLSIISPLMTIVKVLMAPNYPVNFSAGYVGDILTSTFRVIIHFLFASIYSCLLIISWIVNDSRFTSSLSKLWWDCNHVVQQILVPYITLIPLWIRLLQCLRCAVQSGRRWPHLGNAFKYAFTFVILSLGIFDAERKESRSWIAALIFATLVQLSWDIFMDWGMSFRRSLLINSRWIYVVIVVINVFLRFSWIISLSDNQQLQDVHAWECSSDDIWTNSRKKNIQNNFGRIHTVYLESCLCIFEVVRRWIWGILRLEYEQLNLLGNPRESKEIVDADFDDISIETNDFIFISSMGVPKDGNELDTEDSFTSFLFDKKYWTYGADEFEITRAIHMITGLESLRFSDVSWIPRLIEILSVCVLLLIFLVYMAS